MPHGPLTVAAAAAHKALVGGTSCSTRFDGFPLPAIPDRSRRRSGVATLAALIAFGLYGAFGAIGGISEQTWGGGWNWYALVFAALENALAVLGSVWLLAVAQRRLNRRLRWVAPAASRSAYGAFILQSVVLIGLAMAHKMLQMPGIPARNPSSHLQANRWSAQPPLTLAKAT